MRGEEARTAIGVSIGREQTRFTSPRTPANEKAAAIDREGGFFGSVDGVLDGTTDDFPETRDDDDEDERESSRLDRTTLSQVSPTKSVVRQPSPWRVPDPKQISGQRSSKTRTILQNGFFGRKRSWSGPDSWLPSLPKGFNMTSPFSSSRETARDSGSLSSSPRRSTMGTTSGNSRPDTRPQQSISPAHEEVESPIESEEARATVGSLPSNSQLQRIKSSTKRPPPLRRSTSDNSLITQRTLSRVSSLGDDTRFEHIQEQV